MRGGLRAECILGGYIPFRGFLVDDMFRSLTFVMIHQLRDVSQVKM